MSSPTSLASSKTSEAPLYRKPKADVFTVLLIVALFGLLTATGVLWLVMGTYNYMMNRGAPAPSWNSPRAVPAVAPWATSESSQNV